MLHMLSRFNLKPDVLIEDFQKRVDEFTLHLVKLDLIQSTGPIGRRQRHPVMDTDDTCEQEYFFVMSFRDQEQCDRSVEYIYRREKPAETAHKFVFSLVSDPVFTCWEDI
jgi:hypothetical protein